MRQRAGTCDHSSYVNHSYGLEILMLSTNELIGKVMLLHTADYDKWRTDCIWVSNERPTGDTE